VLAADAGCYDVVLTGCGDTTTLSRPALPTVVCYPNCDASLVPPSLNVADFSCFLNRFAAGCN
jgi:hypothetical protein